MIILLAPDLEALLDDADSVPRLLSRVFARATKRSIDSVDAATELVTGQSIGPAAIARRYDRPNDASGHWIFADPVILRPDLSAVWIQPARFEPIDQPAVAELDKLFAEFGLSFDLVRPGRAYLRLSHESLAAFAPPWALEGQSMEHVLPKGEDSRRWIQLLNECQILLHQHAGEVEETPSGLWFWGSGSLPRSRPSARVSHLIGAEPGLLELAEWLKLSYAPAESGTPDGSLRAWSPELEHAASESLDRLEALIRPLWRRLLLGSIDALELATRRTVFRVTPSDARRFWRRAAQ